ncbi:hypothetical protein CRG98_031224 [Punica granatum]|uniref:Uncharacterized protein n=1 Tax=Punica granatum TaxID=22663 RepID=A0A2I0IWH2_PUNGR|nr:hypothetical protein CRG98_031224 [Punica granatum]
MGAHVVQSGSEHTSTTKIINAWGINQDPSEPTKDTVRTRRDLGEATTPAKYHSPNSTLPLYYPHEIGPYRDIRIGNPKERGDGHSEDRHEVVLTRSTTTSLSSLPY